MSTSGSRLHFTDCKQSLKYIRTSIADGTIEKEFENEDFVFDLLKLMYEDGVDIAAKTEYLSTLEQFGSESLDANSVDQAISTLLNLFHQYKTQDEYVNFCFQLLITVTTLLINSAENSEELSMSVADRMWDFAAAVNDVQTRRLRGCACRCLQQLEEFLPGVMWKWKDSVLQVAREERTEVCQDYICLLATILHHMTKIASEKNQSEELTKLQRLLSQPSNLAEELLPAVSFIMDICAILTPSALWNIIISLVATLRNSPTISPSIFKPLMLHHMATFDPSLQHIIIYLQMEYSTETLTETEENKLRTRLVLGANHSALSPAHRLLLLQWIKGYSACEKVEMGVSTYIREKQHDKFFPSVFDSLDVHIEKLNILNHCLARKKESYTELLKSLQYLRKLVLVTGEVKAALGLFKTLFRFYKIQDNENITKATLEMTFEIFSKFPHLIPFVLNFISCIKEISPERSVHMDILSSLHKQVLETPAEKVLQQYQYYLQVFQTSAKETSLNQQDTVKYLQCLVNTAVCLDQCGWYFGNDVLAVCKNILLYHSTEYVFSVLGELLFEIFHNYDDTDIQDRARFYYALLTGASDTKIQDVLSAMKQGDEVTGNNFTTLLPGSLSLPEKTELFQADSSMFEWRRIKVEPRITVKEKSAVEDNLDKFTQTEFLSNYFNRLQMLEVEIEVKCCLKLKAESEFEVIHAVSVLLENCENYQQVKDMHIACMERNDEREVHFILKPMVPLPGHFKTSIMFASSEKKTHTTVLDSLNLSFIDLFIPFPWQQLNLMGNGEEAFTNLWDYFTSEDRQPSESILSVKVLQCTLKKVQSALSQFFVNTGRRHLLLKVTERVEEEKLVVMIATDYWQLLPHVNSYLESLQ